LKLKATKCTFFYHEVEFVGHLVGEKGIRVMPGKIERIVQWPTPMDWTTLKGFLRLAGYYRRFIDNFAEKALPLTRLMRKTVVFEWRKEEEKAFEILKEALTKSPVLAKLNFGKEWLLEVDTSGESIGAVLSQNQESGDAHPVYFWSRQLGRAE
jgi:hypothetical protein